jgi:carbonic anhydrase
MRRWIPSALVFLAAMVGGHVAARLAGPEPAAASNAVAESAPSAAEVRRWLMGGNALFATGEAVPTDIDPIRRASIAAGQTPWCTVLTCADSRVPPEHLFDAGLGRVFTVRVAGNIAEPVTIGSVEYAAEHLHTPLIMVLGHERCGAVTAALSPKSLGPNLDALLGYIRPGIAGIDDLDEAIRANVNAQLASLRKSAVLAELEAEGKISFLGAVYDLDTGLVTPLDSGGHVAAAAGHGHDHGGVAHAEADAGHAAPTH